MKFKLSFGVGDSITTASYLTSAICLMKVLFMLIENGTPVIEPIYLFCLSGVILIMAKFFNELLNGVTITQIK